MAGLERPLTFCSRMVYFLIVSSKIPASLNRIMTLSNASLNGLCFLKKNPPQLECQHSLTIYNSFLSNLKETGKSNIDLKCIFIANNIHVSVLLDEVLQIFFLTEKKSCPVSYLGNLKPSLICTNRFFNNFLFVFISFKL